MDLDALVENANRDSVFLKLKQQPENNYCFDCNTQSPVWCSATLGIFICYDCTTYHRGLGSHLIFVRSSEMDKWTQRQLLQMQAGGNKRLREFLRTHGVSGKPDYHAPLLERWRTELAQMAVEQQPEAEAPEPVKPMQAPAPITAKAKEAAPKPVHRFKRNRVPQAQLCQPVDFSTQEEFYDAQPLKRPDGPLTFMQAEPQAAQFRPIQRKEPEKKAFSSEDFQKQAEDNHAHRARMAQLAGQTAISSDMYFGREDASKAPDSDLLRGQAAEYASIAADKMQKLTSKTKDFFSNLKNNLQR